MNHDKIITQTFVCSLGQKSLKRLAANRGEDGSPDNNFDWSLRRVAESSFESPPRHPGSSRISQSPGGGAIGGNGGQVAWRMSASAPEKLSSSRDSGLPPRHPFHALQTTVPGSSPMTGWSFQGNNSHRRPGPKMWTFEVSLNDINVAA